MQRDVSWELERPLSLTQQIMKAFIAEYKASPELWNPEDPNYCNKYKKAQAQDRLLPILRGLQTDATRIDVRYKINTLRTNYNKVLGKIKAAEAEGRVYVPTSWTYHELRFLDAINNPQAESNENGSEERDDSSKEYEDENTNEIKFEDSGSNTVSYVEIGDTQESIEEVRVRHNGRTKSAKEKPKLARYIIVDGTKRTTNQQRKTQPELQRRRTEAKPERINPSPSNTAIEPIALVWSSKLQTLRPRQRLFAEKAINDILFEASLNNLQKGAMVTNAGISSVSYKKANRFPVEYKEEYLDDVSTDEDVS